MKFLIKVDSFIILFQLEIHYQRRFQELSLLNYYIIVNRLIYLTNTLPNQIINNNNVKYFKIEVEDF